MDSQIHMIEKYKEAITSSGMNAPDEIIPGKMIRFSDNGGKNKDGWCILHINPDGSAGGKFGNWKSIEESHGKRCPRGHQ